MKARPVKTRLFLVKESQFVKGILYRCVNVKEYLGLNDWIGCYTWKHDFENSLLPQDVRFPNSTILVINLKNPVDMGLIRYGSPLFFGDDFVFEKMKTSVTLNASRIKVNFDDKIIDFNHTFHPVY